MPVAETAVRTDRAKRYLTQLCRHAEQMRRHRTRRGQSQGDSGQNLPHVVSVECSETRGTIHFGSGRCVLSASPDTLTVHAEADDQQSLERLQGLIAHRLVTIGRRDELHVEWPAHRPSSPHPPGVPPAGLRRAPGGWSRVRSHLRGMSLGAVGVGVAVGLIVATHLGLLGATLGTSRRTGWLLIIVLVTAIAAKIIGVRHLVVQRRRNSAGPRTAAPDDPKPAQDA